MFTLDVLRLYTSLLPELDNVTEEASSAGMGTGSMREAPEMIMRQKL